MQHIRCVAYTSEKGSKSVGVDREGRDTGREQAGSVKVSGMSGLAQSTREAVYHKTKKLL